MFLVRAGWQGEYSETLRREVRQQRSCSLHTLLLIGLPTSLVWIYSWVCKCFTSPWILLQLFWLLAQVCVSFQFSSVTQSCSTLHDPMDYSMPSLPVYHQLTEFTQTHVHCVGDAIQPSHSLSFPSPPAFNLSQHQGLFQRVSFFASGCQSIGVSASALPRIFRTVFL